MNKALARILPAVPFNPRDTGKPLRHHLQGLGIGINQPEDCTVFESGCPGGAAAGKEIQHFPAWWAGSLQNPPQDAQGLLGRVTGFLPAVGWNIMLLDAFGHLFNNLNH